MSILNKKLDNKQKKIKITSGKGFANIHAKDLGNQEGKRDPNK